MTEKSYTKTELFWGFDNAGFFKNNEYKGLHVNGYTLTGAWVRPKLILSLAGKFEFEAGWHYLRYNGTERAAVSIPWISSKLKLNKNWQMILGNLNYSHLHNLILPLWEPERFLTDKPEAGLQFLHHSDKVFFDNWVNWEQFIQKNDPFQEHFTFGSSLDWNFFSGDDLKISYPLQVLFFHKGGEIDLSPLHVQTFVNLATGMETNFNLHGFVNELTLSGYMLLFKDSRKNMGLPAESGSGFFISSIAKTKVGEFELNYWKGKNFYALKGMKLLQSGSEDDQRIWVPLRNMFSVNYTWKKEVHDGILTGFRAEGWFDLKTGVFSNAGSVFILVNQRYLLKKF